MQHCYFVPVSRLETVYSNAIRKAELEARLQYLKVSHTNHMQTDMHVSSSVSSRIPRRLQVL